MKRNVLILYNEADTSTLEHIVKHLSVLTEEYDSVAMDTWNDQRLIADSNWELTFEAALDQAGTIILLLSRAFLDSRLFQTPKIRARLKDKQEGGFPIIPVPVNKCSWKRHAWLKALTVFPGGDKQLTDLSLPVIDKTLAELTDHVGRVMRLDVPISEGYLGRLDIKNVGPVKEFRFEPARRLNIITGDNSFGKTMLLEWIWWTATGQWANHKMIPNDRAAGEAEARFQLVAKSGAKGKVESIPFDVQKNEWTRHKQKDSATLAVYARADGSFAVYDPQRTNDGNDQTHNPLVLQKSQIIYGLSETNQRQETRTIFKGLLADWNDWFADWKLNPETPFSVFIKILEHLSACSGETLKPGESTRIPGKGVDDYPTIRYPYGDVPIIYTASSVQRIVNLAYLLLWLWLEHRRERKRIHESPYKSMIVLVDEIESHLHPRWQRTIIPALMEVSQYLDLELDIQFILTTHSPLVLASTEPFFNENMDKLFNIARQEDEIELREEVFYRRGRVDHWLTSDVIGLNQARSLEAEQAINDAKKLQLAQNPTREEAAAMHQRLTALLSDFDSFWPRWTYFAEELGVDV